MLGIHSALYVTAKTNIVKSSHKKMKKKWKKYVVELRNNIKDIERKRMNEVNADL